MFPGSHIWEQESAHGFAPKRILQLQPRRGRYRHAVRGSVLGRLARKSGKLRRDVLQQPAPAPSQPPAVSWYMLQCSASAAAGTPPAAGGVISTALGWTDLLTEESFGDAAPGSPYDRAGAISMLEGLQTVASALTEANEAVGVGARWELAQAAAMKTLRLDMPPPSIPAEPDPGWKTWDALQRLMRDGDPYIRTAAQSLASRREMGFVAAWCSRTGLAAAIPRRKRPRRPLRSFWPTSQTGKSISWPLIRRTDALPK